jgi:sodium/potassium-transporting ATPase subunit alpha
MESGALSEKIASDADIQVEDGNQTSPAVIFPGNNGLAEKPIASMRSKGTELRRQITQEDIELAAAGYEHLDQKAKKKDQASKLDQNVDLTEHCLPLTELGGALNTCIDSKDPSKSPGLTPEEAAARLIRDGPNVLTPPRKKSAFRKVLSVIDILTLFTPFTSI